ncbi:hypothetical protein N431DRAFT_385062 [Stipitochalara longipes BDJ]|nr:hypothetical protein N431DRAFT_385062 [Stipitochalara longipes BDJ]
MPLPSPTLSFTIPSIHDDTVLQCRVYHPACLAPTSISQFTPWNKKAAIVAHPYAVLGGCYDDPVVDLVSSTILEQGFLVGTFNFRGAGASKGRTSYQSKPEQSDYLSFVGFMIYYMHLLSPPPMTTDLYRFTHFDPELHDLTPVPSQALPPPHLSGPRFVTATVNNSTADAPAIAVQEERPEGMNTGPRLLLAGYSYGALVTTHLPPIITSIIAQFQNPTEGSAHAEIRLRAGCLAAQQNEVMQTQISSLLNANSHNRGRSLHADDLLHSPKLRKPGGGVRMGGEENLRRASHDSHRSRSSFSMETPEMVRKSVDRVRSIGKTKRFSPKRQNTQGSTASSRVNGSQSSFEHIPPEEDPGKIKDTVVCKEIPGIGTGLQTAYLLISPLQGLVSHLLTLWSSRSWKDQIPDHEMKFTVDPSLVVFGDDDLFVSAKRLRSWAGKLSEASGGNGRFKYAEVSGAGHFWQDFEAVKILQAEVQAFVKNL